MVSNLALTKVKETIKKLLKFSYKQLLLSTSIILTVMVLIIISVVSYYSTVNFIIEKSENADKSALDQFSQKINSNLSEIENITKYLSKSDVLLSYLQSYENISKNSYNDVVISNEVLLLLQKIKNNNEQIDVIAVFARQTVFSTDTNLIYIGNNDIIMDSIIGKALKGSGQTTLFFESDYNYVSGKDSSSALKVIASRYSFGGLIKKNEKVYGSVFVILKKDWCNNLIGSYSNMLIANKNRDILVKGNGLSGIDNSIFADKKLDIDDSSIQKLNNKRYKLLTNKSVFANMDIIYFESIDKIYSELELVKKFVFIDLLLSIIASVIISSFISAIITRPILKLTMIANKYKSQSEKAELYKNNHSAKRQKYLQKSIMYYLIVVIIVPALIYTLVYQVYSSKIIDKKIIESNRLIFDQTIENIDIYLGTKVKILKNIIYNGDIQKTLFEEKNSDAELNDIIKTYLLMDNNRDEVYLYKADKNLLISNINDNGYGIFSENYIELLKQNDKRPLWIGSSKDLYGRYMISLFREIKNINSSSSSRSNMEVIGYISMLIDENNLRNIYKDILDNNSYICVTDNNIVISSSKSEMIGKKAEFGNYKNDNILTINSNKYLCFYGMTKTTNWAVTSLFDYNIAFKEKNKILSDNIYLLILLLFVIIFVSNQLSFSLLSPLSKMNTVMSKLNIMDMDSYFPEEYFINEVEELGKTYNSMVLRIEKLIDEILVSKIKTREIEDQKKEAEIMALQAQINPHFLNNTLQFIKLEINEARNEQAMTMINALNDLFRFGICRTDTIITIEQELKYAKAYTKIIELRYHEKIIFEWEINQEILGYKTLKLILQPIIENAVYHGIKNKKAPGKIKIVCIETSKDLQFTVEDDGIGIDSSTLDGLNTELQKSEISNRVGLFNVQKRINLYFGKDYGLKLYSKVNHGTIVEINLPKIVN